MIENPKLSVAVITYSQEKFISKTISEILNQKTEFSYNVIIGEDCSNDSTAKICDTFQKENPETIKVIHNSPNLGAMKNYYNVLKNCDGEYLMVCAGDDHWLPNKIQTQIDFMEKNADVDFVYGKVTGINEDGAKVKFEWGENVETFNEVFSNEATIPPVTMCVRKSVMDKYLQEIDPENSNWKMEDYPFYLWLFKNRKAVFLDDFFAAYRVMENSISHSSDAEKEIQFQKSVKDVRDFYIEKYALDDSYRRTAEEIFARNRMGIAISHRNRILFDDSFKNLKEKTFRDYVKKILVDMNLYCFFKAQ